MRPGDLLGPLGLRAARLFDGLDSSLVHDLFRKTGIHFSGSCAKVSLLVYFSAAGAGPVKSRSG
jgi:hypothetical protein